MYSSINGVQAIIPLCLLAVLLLSSYTLIEDKQVDRVRRHLILMIGWEERLHDIEK